MKIYGDIIMKKYVFIVILMTFLLQTGFAYAHEFDARKKRAMMTELVKEHKKYQSCLEKAKDALDTEQAEKLCRKKYAMQRMFKVKDLYHFYMEHILEAEELYSDLLIAVRGKVHRISKSPLGFPEVVFALDDFGVTGVRCEFPQSVAKKIAELEVGQEVTIGGISKGLFNDDYVRLTHCEILKQ